MTTNTEALRAALISLRQVEVQALHAAFSNSHLAAAEIAGNKLRDKLDDLLRPDAEQWVTIPARDGIEARYGLNDTWPGDPVRVKAEALVAALAKVSPIECNDTENYAEVVFGEHQSQAMTMVPNDWRDIENAYLALRAALPTAQPDGWSEIGSAPKDGSKFDAWVPDAFGGHRMTNLSFNWRGKLRQHGTLTEAELPRWPTHWRPLPKAPTDG